MMEQTAYATAPPVLYELSGVEKSCEGPAERITILKNMDLTVRAGESLAIVGASGIGQIHPPPPARRAGHADRGQGIVRGQKPAGHDARGKSPFPQQKAWVRLPVSPPAARVFHRGKCGHAGAHRRDEPIEGAGAGAAGPRTRRAFRQEGSQGNHPFGGERQRAAIARAILLEPRVLLADEPTGNLDQRTGDSVAELLLELNRTLGMTLVIVTHNREMAGTLGRCLELRSGELYEEMRTRAAGAGAV